MTSPYQVAAKAYAVLVDDLNTVPAAQRNNFLTTVFNIVAFMDQGVLRGLMRESQRTSEHKATETSAEVSD